MVQVEKPIIVKSNDDEETKEQKDKESTKAKDSTKDKKDSTNKKVQEQDLTEDDKALQEELNYYIQLLTEENADLYLPTLNQLRVKIKASTTSMTSVPKPLKFLMPHYSTLKGLYEKFENTEVKALCADIISVLAMVVNSAIEARECLMFQLLGSHEDIGCWGHEYVRHLTDEVVIAWSEEKNPQTKMAFRNLIDVIVPYHMSHNAEIEACDFLMAIECSDLIQQYVNEETFTRVAQYLISCAPYNPDDIDYYECAMQLYEKFNCYPEALRLAINTCNTSEVQRIFWKCPDEHVRKQMAFMIARSHMYLDLTETIDEEHSEFSDLDHILSNEHLNVNFMTLGRELDIMEPKSPKEIYKSEFDQPRMRLSTGSKVDSARQNLASSFVNGFVNAGFGKDKLFAEDGQKWLYKNKENAMISAMASFGLVQLWDVDGGLGQIDKYLYSADENIKAGALLACGIINCGIRNECDPALALLGDHVLSPKPVMRIASVIGLGIAYVGKRKSEVISLLLEAMIDPLSSVEVVCFSALSCSLIAVEPQESICSSILNILHGLSPNDFNNSLYIFLPLALGICYLKRGSEAEAVIEALQILPDPFMSLATTLVKVCSYAGTGNVLIVQSLLHICSEYRSNESASPTEADKSKEGKTDTENKTDDKKAEEKKKDDKKEEIGFGMNFSSQQAVAVLGIALISMGEDIGVEMTLRTFSHLFRYGDPIVKRAVPLAMGLISVSNPKSAVIEVLGKYSHDADPDVHRNAIFALGLSAAGTNNARVANMLRQLALYHDRLPDSLFVIRLAQGLVHLAKSTMTLSPFYSDRTLLRHESIGGLLSVLISLLDAKTTILGSSHYMLYYIVCAMQPRMLTTFDENLKPLPVAVRVGQAVDVIGQAGKPKTITGFHTHTTPVLLGHNDRAELATEKYIPLTPVLEGCVILRENPNSPAVVF